MSNNTPSDASAAGPQSNDRRPTRLSPQLFKTSLLATFAAAPTLALSAWLHYQNARFIYGFLAKPANASLVTAGRWIFFSLGIFAIIGAIVWFKMRRPSLGNQPFSLFILSPFWAFAAFSDWLPAILILLLLIAMLFFTQMPGFGQADELRTPTQGWGKAYERLGAARLLAFLALLSLGIWLMLVARSWAKSAGQLDEVKEKNIYAEYDNLSAVLAGQNPEYVRLSGKGLKVSNKTERKFGSGDDSYYLAYALLTDRPHNHESIHEWPAWVYCPSGYSPGEFPMIFRVVRCKVGNDCPENMLKVRSELIRTGFARPMSLNNPEDFAARPGQVLIELIPEFEMARTDGAWQRKVSLLLAAVFAAQLAYSLLHMIMLLVMRRRLISTFPNDAI